MKMYNKNMYFFYYSLFTILLEKNKYIYYPTPRGIIHQDCSLGGLNSRLSAHKTDALPTELNEQMIHFIVIHIIIFVISLDCFYLFIHFG